MAGSMAELKVGLKDFWMVAGKAVQTGNLKAGMLAKQLDGMRAASRAQ